MRVAFAVSLALVVSPCAAQQPARGRAAVLVAAEVPAAREAVDRLGAALAAHAGFAPDAITVLDGDRVNDREVRAAVLAAGKSAQAATDGLLFVAWVGYGPAQQLGTWLEEARGANRAPVLLLDLCRPSGSAPPAKVASPAAAWVLHGARDGQLPAVGEGGERFLFTRAFADKLAEFAARNASATLDAVFWSSREVTLQQSQRRQDPDLVPPVAPALAAAGTPALVAAPTRAQPLPNWTCQVLDATPGAKTGYPSKVKDAASGITFRLVEPGEFQMGSRRGEDDERPVHRVRITKPYYLAETETTQAQWLALMATNSSRFQGPRLPVDSASWDDAQAFVRKLNGADAGPFRLPTEAEWEYACRAGTATEYGFGDVISTEQANYDGDRTWGGGRPGKNRERTVEAGALPPNAWGFREMHGNVWEWCQDWFDSDYYAACRDGVDDPQGPASGSAHVARGGSWCSNPVYLRSSYRLDTTFQLNRLYTGFRVARSI